MRVAVTGASGHVGNCLCRELIRKGNNVKALVHENEDDLVQMGTDIVRGDILDKSAVENLCRGAEVIYHLAAKISIDRNDRELVHSINVNGTQNVLDVLAGLNKPRLVHFSTIHTFKPFNSHAVLDESNPTVTHSSMNYENSKAEAERRVLKAASEGLNALVLNPTAIIGPYDYQPSLLGQALIKIYLNKLPMLVEGGYDFIDVRDVADAAIQAATRGKPGQKYILSGSWSSLRDLSLKIGEVTGRRTPGMVAPTLVAHVGLPFLQAWAKITRTHPLYTRESLEILKHAPRNISNSRARQELGLNPRPLEESLRDIFEWFNQNNLV